MAPPPRASGRSGTVTALLVALVALLAFGAGGAATWWFLLRSPETPAPAVPPPTHATTAATSPTSPAAPQTAPGDATSQPTVEPGDPTQLWPVDTDPSSYTVESALDLARARDLRCLDERHPEIISVMCFNHDLTVQMYLGGSLDGTLHHISATGKTWWSWEEFGALWPAIGLELMPEDELDLEAVADLLYSDDGPTPDVTMGGRVVRAVPHTAVVFTTLGWADGLAQPGFFPTYPNVLPHLMDFGEFTCDSEADDRFHCYEQNDPDTIWSVIVNGTAAGVYATTTGAADLEAYIQTVALHVAEWADPFREPILDLAPGEATVVDHVWLTHVWHREDDLQHFEFYLEASCWAESRPDC